MIFDDDDYRDDNDNNDDDDEDDSMLLLISRREPVRCVTVAGRDFILLTERNKDRKLFAECSRTACLKRRLKHYLL